MEERRHLLSPKQSSKRSRYYVQSSQDLSSAVNYEDANDITSVESFTNTSPNFDFGKRYLPTPINSSPPGFTDDINGSTEKNDVVVKKVETRLYSRRWYILVIYSLFSATQNLVWNTWGPISAASEDAFGWVDSNITMLSNWGPISYIIGAVFFSWLIGAKGIRLAVLLSMALTVAGCAVRCITPKPPAVMWLCNLGAGLYGLAGPVAMFGPSVLSTTWFGPHERTTATAISVIISNLGLSVSFLLGPFLVPDRTNPNCTSTQPNSSFFESDRLLDDDCTKYFNNSVHRIKEERHDIMLLMYIECAWSVLLMVVLVIYFPSRPPLPPCASAAQKREDFWTGFKQLFGKGQFWVVTFVYGVTLGVGDCWQGLVDVIVKPYGISEAQAGWMGFWATIAMMVVSFVVARFADKFSRHFKLFIFGLYALGAVAVACFTMACVGILPSNLVLIYATFIVANASMYAAIPLIYELSCELTFPIDEATANSVLTLMNNVVAVVFLLVPLVPHIGTSWMNWTMVGALAICMPPILFLKERYNRLELDDNTNANTIEPSLLDKS